MSERTPLFTTLFGERFRVHTHDPDTSHAMAAKPRTGIRARVAAHLQAHPEGLTDDELHEMGTGTRHRHSTATRRRELCDAGLVEATEGRRVNVDGNAAVVWRWIDNQSEET